LRATIRKSLFLLLCLSISIFTVARATKLAHAFAPKTDAKALVNDANTEEEMTSDYDDSMEVGSNDEGEDANDDDGGDAAADQDIGDDDAGNDDGGDDAVMKANKTNVRF
jgi:hypothetical protein